jgi:hypothetical protein
MHICDHVKSEHCKELHNNDWFECSCRIPHEPTIDCLTKTYCEGVYSRTTVVCIEQKGEIKCSIQ